MRACIWMVALGMAAALGCDRTHLSDSYGRSVRRALAAQVDLTERIKPQRPAGLDPEEAAVVLETYRRSLSPKGQSEAASRPQVLLVTPANGANQPPGGAP